MNDRVTDEGFGLIEIVVAMFMIAAIALAALPLLVSGLQASAKNSSITSATGMLTEQMTLARAKVSSSGSKCSNLTAFVAAAPATLTDGSGRTLVATDSVTCPATYPGTATYTVSVTASGSPAALATASTLIFVSSN